MCRQTVSAQITFPKNYTVEQILNTIQPVDDDDPMTENEVVNAMSLLVSRLFILVQWLTADMRNNCISITEYAISARQDEKAK